ncbi:MAG: class I SAM-dependent methyltransferase [Patescibacteria group bacterium]
MNILKHYFILFKFALRGNRGFYESREYLAEVLIKELNEFVDLQGKKVLDIGGERGEFCKILAEKEKCQTVNLEPAKPTIGDFVWKTVIGSADKLPFKDSAFDIVLLRGVIQHIPVKNKPKVFQEMHRVLKKDGIAYVMIPPWYSPLSGQNIKPFQYFPFKVARHLRNSIFLSNIKADSINALGIWPMTFTSTQKFIRQANFLILKTVDILGRMHFVTKIPLLREFLLPSVGFILAKNLKKKV